MASSNVALGEDIDRPLILRSGRAADDGGGSSSDGFGGRDKDSTGIVSLRVGSLRSGSASFVLSTLSVDFAAPLAKRTRRSLRLGFEAWPGFGGACGEGCGDGCGESFTGSGGRSLSPKTDGGVGGASPVISMSGLGGRRDPARARDAEEGAEDAALPGRFGPTNVARGASSESESSDKLEDDEDDDEEAWYVERVFLGAGFAGGVADTEEVRGSENERHT